MKYRPQSHEIQGSPVLGDHNTDYFKNWTSQQLYDIDNITRPIEPVTPEIYSERIKKNEVSRNKKMTHCINMATSENAPNWAKDFLQELSSGAINSTTKAKDQATVAGKFIQLRQQKSRPSAITAIYWTCCKTETAR